MNWWTLVFSAATAVSVILIEDIRFHVKRLRMHRRWEARHCALALMHRYPGELFTPESVSDDLGISQRRCADALAILAEQKIIVRHPGEPVRYTLK